MDWQPVCELSALPESSTRAIETQQGEVILVNWFGQVYAYLNNCPHRNWPLNFEPDRFLDCDQQFLQCSNHMALFEVESGTCIAGPCVGQALEPVPVSILEGTIHLPV